MVEIFIKYGDSEIPYEIHKKNLWEIVETKDEPTGVSDKPKEIERAIQNPIGSPNLPQIIKARSNVVITQDDHTRGTPGYLTVPPLLNTLNLCGVPDENITLIFACGTHRAVKSEEQKKLVGEEVFERIMCVSHDCDAPDLVKLGTTSRNTEVKINAIAAKVDHIIATGKVGYHYYAGFSGGRKSIIPGISGRTTINQNHAFLIDERAVTGKLIKNPIHEDMIEAAKMTKTTFMLNIIQNTKKKLLRAFAGDLFSAHVEATGFYDSIYRVKVKGLADIVLVAAGLPHDIDLYQGYKAIDNAQMIVKSGGVIVAALECNEGHGHLVFSEWAQNYRTLEELEAEIKTNFIMGGHKAYYIAKIQQKAKIILISNMNPKEVKDHFMLEPAKTVDDAMDLAYTWVGRDAKVTFMPNGTITLPTTV
ncbi:MAG: nickel-dependent lactate racemase [Candidatus Helarchaeota archaeon]|nr:nickel-dependent lactate racemase [Candidatus Helarchaeota archaeon]